MLWKRLRAEIDFPSRVEAVERLRCDENCFFFVIIPTQSNKSFLYVYAHGIQIFMLRREPKILPRHTHFRSERTIESKLSCRRFWVEEG